MPDEPRYHKCHDYDLAEYLERHTTVQPNGCWEWQRCLDGFGYGLSKWLGKLHRAHRLAYYAQHGQFTPRGIVLRHKCDNPKCCNPAHLVVGTRAENNQDRDDRGRHVALRGEKHGCAKLTPEQVLEIRAAPSHTRGIARLYGVSYAAISSIRTGRAWKHLAETSA